MPPPINSPESLKVQNPEESNSSLDSVHPPKNVDLDLTLNSCADDESDNTIQIHISATLSYGNRATDNGKNSDNTYITDDIFDPCKSLQVFLTTIDSPQIKKELKETTKRGKKLWEHVTHASGTKRISNCKWPLGCANRPCSLICPAPNIYTIPLSDNVSNNNQETFVLIKPASLSTTVNILQMMIKLLNLLLPHNTFLTLANPMSIHATTNCDLYSNLLHYDSSQLLILSLNARSLSSKIANLKILLLLVNLTIVLITETQRKSSMSDHSSHVDNYVFF